jgi:hypothetical protein
VYRFVVTHGIAGCRGRIVGRGSYFGDDFLLRPSYLRPYSAVSLGYLNVLTLTRDAFYDLLAPQKYPRVLVSTRVRASCMAVYVLELLGS